MNPRLLRAILSELNHFEHEIDLISLLGINYSQAREIIMFKKYLIAEGLQELTLDEKLAKFENRPFIVHELSAQKNFIYASAEWFSFCDIHEIEVLILFKNEMRQFYTPRLNGEYYNSDTSRWESISERPECNKLLKLDNGLNLLIFDTTNCVDNFETHILNILQNVNSLLGVGQFRKIAIGMFMLTPDQFATEQLLLPEFIKICQDHFLSNENACSDLHFVDLSEGFLKL